MTHSYAILEVSRATYDEIRQKLKAAAYDHVFHRDAHGIETIDLFGIALQEEAMDDSTPDVETTQAEQISDPPTISPQADGDNGATPSEEAPATD